MRFPLQSSRTSKPAQSFEVLVDGATGAGRLVAALVAELRLPIHPSTPVLVTCLYL